MKAATDVIVTKQVLGDPNLFCVPVVVCVLGQWFSWTTGSRLNYIAKSYLNSKIHWTFENSMTHGTYSNWMSSRNLWEFHEFTEHLGIWPSWISWIFINVLNIQDIYEYLLHKINIWKLNIQTNIHFFKYLCIFWISIKYSMLS